MDFITWLQNKHRATGALPMSSPVDYMRKSLSETNHSLYIAFPEGLYMSVDSKCTGQYHSKCGYCAE